MTYFDWKKKITAQSIKVRLTKKWNSKEKEKIRDDSGRRLCVKNSKGCWLFLSLSMIKRVFLCWFWSQTQVVSSKFANEEVRILKQAFNHIFFECRAVWVKSFSARCSILQMLFLKQKEFFKGKGWRINLKDFLKFPSFKTVIKVWENLRAANNMR